MKWTSELTGRYFGLWTILREGSYVNYKQTVHARCECGTERVVRLDHLLDGKSYCCGCTRYHGLTKVKGYHSWKSIKQRCFNENNADFDEWGGRGITMCEGWLADFRHFFADMGEKPSALHSIDRIDNNGHYSCGHCEECSANGWPLNCKWSTKKEQNRNRRDNRILEFRGESKTLAEWCEILGHPYGRIKNRLLNLGWSVERALSTTKLWTRE